MWLRSSYKQRRRPELVSSDPTFGQGSEILQNSPSTIDGRVNHEVIAPGTSVKRCAKSRRVQRDGRAVARIETVGRKIVRAPWFCTRWLRAGVIDMSGGEVAESRVHVVGNNDARIGKNESKSADDVAALASATRIRTSSGVVVFVRRCSLDKESGKGTVGGVE